MTPPPVQQAPRARRHMHDTIRVREPATYLHDDELAYGFLHHQQQYEKQQDNGVVRVGRGLVSVKKAASGAVKEEREAAFRNRGRKVERAWS